MCGDARTDDLVAGLHLSFGDDAQVETGPMVGHEQRRQPRFAHAHTHPEAGHPRLGDLELGLPDPVPVTDAHLVIGEAIDGEVLTELPITEIVAAELFLPIGVRVDLVNQHGTLLAAMTVQIALPITVNVQAANHLGTSHGRLPDPGVHGPALPRHILGPTNIDRQ